MNNKWTKGVRADETVEVMSVSSFFETFMKERTKKGLVFFSLKFFFQGRCYCLELEEKPEEGAVRKDDQWNDSYGKNEEG